MQNRVLGLALRDSGTSLQFESVFEQRNVRWERRGHNTLRVSVCWKLHRRAVRRWDGRQQVRSQILGLGGQDTFLGGKDFCLYYMFKTIFFWAQQNFGGQKIWKALPPNPPTVATGLGDNMQKTTRFCIFWRSFVQTSLWKPTNGRKRASSIRTTVQVIHTFVLIHIGLRRGIMIELLCI